MPAASVNITSAICAALCIDELPRVLEIFRADRIRGPISERCDRSGRVVAGVLRKRAGAKHKQVGHVPALKIAVEGAGARVRSHDRAAAEMRGLVFGDVVWRLAILLVDL